MNIYISTYHMRGWQASRFEFSSKASAMKINTWEYPTFNKFATAKYLSLAKPLHICEQIDIFRYLSIQSTVGVVGIPNSQKWIIDFDIYSRHYTHSRRRFTFHPFCKYSDSLARPNRFGARGTYWLMPEKNDASQRSKNRREKNDE